MKSNILLRFKRLNKGVDFGPESMKLLTDWFDFADWIKQENERGQSILLIGWTYVSRKKE